MPVLEQIACSSRKRYWVKLGNVEYGDLLAMLVVAALEMHRDDPAAFKRWAGSSRDDLRRWAARVFSSWAYHAGLVRQHRVWLSSGRFGVGGGVARFGDLMAYAERRSQREAVMDSFMPSSRGPGAASGLAVIEGAELLSLLSADAQAVVSDVVAGWGSLALVIESRGWGWSRAEEVFSEVRHVVAAYLGLPSSMLVITKGQKRHIELLFRLGRGYNVEACSVSRLKEQLLLAREKLAMMDGRDGAAGAREAGCCTLSPAPY
jgi:hypothetical protein